MKIDLHLRNGRKVRPTVAQLRHGGALVILFTEHALSGTNNLKHSEWHFIDALIELGIRKFEHRWYVNEEGRLSFLVEVKAVLKGSELSDLIAKSRDGKNV